jgi:hypothetical protein
MTVMAEWNIAKLQAHAERVCEAVLGPVVSDIVSVSAHVADDNLPAHIPATHEYMIEVDLSAVPELMAEMPQRFGSFLGKSVLPREENACACLYWGEGEPLEAPPVAPATHPVLLPAEIRDATSLLNDIEWLKVDTILPNWLDCVLFDALGARYEPDWQRFEHNLDLDEDAIKVYLGTYFPRSYAEAFCILDALLENAAYSAAWRDKTEASFLDVGTGTGGNLVGLLTALGKHCPNLKTVTVHGFDGNTLALDAAKFVLEAFASQAAFKVDVSLTAQCMALPVELHSPHRNSYDFISTFKMGGEIVSAGGGSSDNFYHQFLTSYTGFLSDIGLLLLLDVTTKPDHTDFYPQLLNEQVSRFVRSQTGFATIIPVPCHLHENRCSEPCFTQKEFCVTHRAARNDRSRVAYRVLSRKACADKLHVSTQADAEYVTFNKAANGKFSSCAHSAERGTMQDGFRLST